MIFSMVPLDRDETIRCSKALARVLYRESMAIKISIPWDNAVEFFFQI